MHECLMCGGICTTSLRTHICNRCGYGGDSKADKEKQKRFKLYQELKKEFGGQGND